MSVVTLEVHFEREASAIVSKALSADARMQQPGQQLSVFIAKLSPLEAGNERLNLCGVSRILVWIFLHRRRRRFYAARRSGGESERAFFAFFTLVSRKHTVERVFVRPEIGA
jgi:hypothetical protein